MFEAFEMTSCAVDSLFDTRVSARDQSETYKTSRKIAVSSNPVISLIAVPTTVASVDCLLKLHINKTSGNL